MLECFTVSLSYGESFKSPSCHLMSSSCPASSCCGAPSSSCIRPRWLWSPSRSPATSCSPSSQTAFLHTWRHGCCLPPVSVSDFTIYSLWVLVWVLLTENHQRPWCPLEMRNTKNNLMFKDTDLDAAQMDDCLIVNLHHLWRTTCFNSDHSHYYYSNIQYHINRLLVHSFDTCVKG